MAIPSRIRNILEQYKSGEIAIHVAEELIEQPLWDIWHGLTDGVYRLGFTQSDAVDPAVIADAISKAMGWMDDDVQEPKEVTDETN